MTGPFPLDAGGEVLRMGLSRLPLDGWIEPAGGPAGDLAERLRTKDRLFSERYDEVVRARPGSERAQSETLVTLAGHLCRRFPREYRRVGDDVEIVATGAKVGLAASDTPAVERAGRLVGDDLCLLQLGADGSHRLTAASLCSPSYWLLGEKIGHPLSELHAPVPGYQNALASKVEAFLNRLSPERPMQRANWSISRSPELFRPGIAARRDEPDDRHVAADFGTRAFLRVERQTFRRLPDSGAVVFTIKVYVNALEEVAADPLRARALAVGLQNLDSEMLSYKGLEDFAPALIDWLSNFAAR